MDTNAPADGKPAVANLVGPRMPADNGLSSLGLIMQLGGSIYMGFMAIIALLPVLAAMNDARMPLGWVFFVVGTLCAIRSAFHRAAGTALLYGSPAGPIKPTMHYIMMAAIQTAICLLMFKSKLEMPGEALVWFAMLWMAWPLTLAVLMATPRFQRFHDEIPAPEDLGFEGTSVLMLILGIIGVLVTGLVLLLMFNAPGSVFDNPQGLLIFGILGMLLVRSVFHALAGQQGTRGIGMDEATESARRYFNFGVTSSIIAGGALLMVVMITGMPFMEMLFMIAIMVFMLLQWPMLLRRFYGERNFAVMLAGDEAPNFRRAPDAGLTALGWLLLALSVMSLASSLPMALLGLDKLMGRGDMSGFAMLGGADLAGTFGKSVWWSVLLGGLQLWAAIELITMSDRHKIAALAYGVGAAAITIFVVMWPFLKDLDRFSRMVGGGRGLDALMGNVLYGQIALALVIPVCAIVLVLRRQDLQARARFRAPDPQP